MALQVEFHRRRRIMSTKEQIDKELMEYLNKEPNLSRNDRITYLRAIFYKHLEINQLEHVINNYDLHVILGDAKGIHANIKLPMNITGKRVAGHEVVHVSVLESFVRYLNSMHLLKKLTKFDY